MKFSTVIAIAIIAIVASLAMVDTTPVLNRRAPPAEELLPPLLEGIFQKSLPAYEVKKKT
jgi:hypothetical protein